MVDGSCSPLGNPNGEGASSDGAVLRFPSPLSGSVAGRTIHDAPCALQTSSPCRFFTLVDEMINIDGGLERWLWKWWQRVKMQSTR